MRPKRAKGARLDPKNKWAFLSQYWPPMSPVPQMANRTPGPQLAIFNPGICQSPDQAQQVFPLIQGKDSPSPKYCIPWILSACDSKPEHKHDSQNTINQWYSQNTTKTWN
ncbi:hypothetical protein O181_123003 [Austropuccinia psidii MF-1]|uniref:Uncharacterized protein n=1 Tax=Austropuccinia psidii MF-1 TaxID=1389203 RepID=A0A9Q3KKE4_9BASI|nr:hypothetical protein [Austropuccinia psidii MF-1]